MALPTNLRRDTVTVLGQSLEIRTLSRREALHLSTFKAPEDAPDETFVDAAEVYILMCGTGQSEDECKAFRDGNDSETVDGLITAILTLSRLGPPKDEAATDPLADLVPKSESNGHSSTETLTLSTSTSP